MSDHSALVERLERLASHWPIGGTHHSVMDEAASAIRSLTAQLDAEKALREGERERIVAYMRDAIGEGYPSPPNKVDQCAHGQFGWEDCIACYDEVLEAKLEAIERGDHLPALPGEG
jgi:hypothetical protein